MRQYISKDALVAKINKIIKTNKECMLGLRNLDYYQGKVDALNDTLFSLDTLEVKEVDLEKEIGKYLDTNDIEFSHQIKLFNFAKHFYELGMLVSNKAQKGE